MKLQFVECTHIGGRPTNQDYFTHVVDDDWAFFCIADGLGGHDHGEFASQYFLEALSSLASKYAQDILVSPSASMKAMIDEAGQLYRDRVDEEFPTSDLQTTLAVAWIDPTHLVTAHIGDSRIYRIHNNTISWRSPDHTMVQKYYEEGKIKEHEMSEHPMQNRLLNSLSTFEAPKPEILIHPALKKEETLILCTDGFWGPCKDKDKIKLAHAQDLKKTLIPMLQTIADSDPDSDNITVQVIQAT